MALPTFHDPDRTGEFRAPDVAAAVAAGREADLAPAVDDTVRRVLLLVDAQLDFVSPAGALSVPGAVGDSRRTARFLFENAGRITTIAASLDTHLPRHIFFADWWTDADGRPPEPFTAIRREDVATGRWRPTGEPRWSRRYVEELETRGRKQLMIWPEHALLGTPGHALEPGLYEAIAFHAAARRTQPRLLTKGLIPATEHYSILEPEVKRPGVPGGVLDVPYLEMLVAHDEIVVAGQAKSHCVLETIRSLMNAAATRPEVAGKIRVLADCMSSVPHPEIDFDARADEELAAFAERGLRVASSVEPLG